MIKKLLLLLTFLTKSFWIFSQTTINLNPSQDAFIHSFNTTSNYGSESEIYVNKSNSGSPELYFYTSRGLIKFDLSSIPAGQTITSATLKLTAPDLDGIIGGFMDIHKVTQPWTEGNVTWETFDGLTNWTSSGGDFSSVQATSEAFTNGNTEITWNLTNSVTALYNDINNNNGWLIKYSDESSEDFMLYQYYSKEGLTLPDLEITYVPSTTALKTTWKTDNTSSTASTNTQITIPGFGTYYVSWEEVGNTTNHGSTTVTGTSVINFPSSGTYTLYISGVDFTGIDFKNALGDNLKLLTIENWGNTQFQNLNFKQCENLTSNASGAPDISLMTNLSEMFMNCYNFNGNISSLGTSTITDMNNMFNGASSFNQDLSNWNTSIVTSMESMFENATDFNSDLNVWEVGSVLTMKNMFKNATSFNNLVYAWNSVSLTNTESMFEGATSFNQLVHDWNLTNVTTTKNMFKGATSFNYDVEIWQVANVTNMEGMFNGASAFNQTLENWNIDNVTNMNNILDNTNMNYTNYDNTLNAWSTRTPQSNVNVGAVGRKFCNSSSQRNDLINNFNWTFTGDALDCSAPLPVVFSKFTAQKKQNNIIELTWQTSSEQNNDYFILEKSINNLIWENVIKVNGSLNSTVTKIYNTQDLINNNCYYRLKQVDANGKFTHSKVLFVEYFVNNSFSITPNPIENEFINLIYFGNKDLKTLVTIYDTENKIVYEENISFFENSNKIQLINSELLKSGIYFVKIISDSNTEVNKILVK